jgi:hypothetical protein
MPQPSREKVKLEPCPTSGQRKSGAFSATPLARASEHRRIVRESTGKTTAPLMFRERGEGTADAGCGAKDRTPRRTARGHWVFGCVWREMAPRVYDSLVLLESD